MHAVFQSSCVRSTCVPSGGGCRTDLWQTVLRAWLMNKALRSYISHKHPDEAKPIISSGKILTLITNLNTKCDGKKRIDSFRIEVIPELCS